MPLASAGRVHRLVIVSLLLLAGTAEAGGGFAPPLEIEIGGVDQAGDRTHPETFSTQMLFGLSWASLYPKPTPVDVTLGFAAIIPHVDAPSSVAHGGSMEIPHAQVGGYLDVGIARAAFPHLRTFAGVRGELLHGHDAPRYGAVGRFSVELWKGTCIGGPGGGIIGTLALSVWSEAGMRQRPDGSSGAVFATGLGVRLPLVVAH